MKDKKNLSEGLGISGFTLAVIGIIFTGYLGIVMSIIGIIFCYIQQKKNPNKLAKAGIIIGIIGIVLSIVYLIILIKVLSPALNQQFSQF
ncbi:MAG: hypothetical protein PVJ67_06085 [Candidatus Pacearchaeota archaeon]|jgi:hypothetical protein